MPRATATYVSVCAAVAAGTLRVDNSGKIEVRPAHPPNRDWRVPKGARFAQRRKYPPYWVVSFTLNGVCYTGFAQRIVWYALRGEVAPGMHINHIDGNKQNNAITNLEVVTPAENIAHAKRTGLMKPPPKGRTMAQARLRAEH